MKSFSAAVLVLLLSSCSGDSPTAPSTQPVPPGVNHNGSISGFAHDAAGVCVPGAAVEMLDGPRAGERVIQSDPCGSVWDYSGGYTFSGLPVNLNIRMRASKSGYVSREMTFSTNGPGGQSNFLLLRE